jgi:hypothetical protein
MPIMDHFCVDKGTVDSWIIFCVFKGIGLVHGSFFL